MSNERTIKKEDEGKFGKIIGGEEDYLKTLHGKILYVDYFGTVAFVDNDDILHTFKRMAVKSFEEMEPPE